MKKSQVFNDPIHGTIELPIVCVRIINTPEFQRLKNIKQLGGAYFVYPGASHNRFEHSIGVCHLAGELVKQLQQQLVKEPNDTLGLITDAYVLYVQIAGLCHDLGHGPYSHLFDKHFYPKITAIEKNALDEKGKRKDNGKTRKKGKGSWKHEEFSVMIMKRILKNLQQREQDGEVKNQLKDANGHVDFIEKLIHGIKPGRRRRKERGGGGGEKQKEEKRKSFLCEIVANSRNGVDVDKWDYFARDCHYLGLSSTFDCRRLIKFARVIVDKGESHICYRDKEVHNLYEMFHVRDILYRRVYCHKTTLIIEHMLAEALVEADDILKVVFPHKPNMPSLSECIESEDIDTYLKLDDSIFWLIQHTEDQRLDRAREILNNILWRKQYRCIKRRVIEDTTKFEAKMKQEGLRELEQRWNNLEELKNAKVLVKVAKFDYFNGKNPVNEVLFYSKEEQDKAKRIKLEEVSMMLSPTFKEYVVYFYDKDPDNPDKDQMTSIEEFIENHLRVKPQEGHGDSGGARPGPTGACAPVKRAVPQLCPSGKGKEKRTRLTNP